MTQRAKRTLDIAPCRCGKQPMHVQRMDGRDHLFECPPCGLKTGKHTNEVLARMDWSRMVATPGSHLRSVATNTSKPRPGAQPEQPTRVSASA